MLRFSNALKVGVDIVRRVKVFVVNIVTWRYRPVRRFPHISMKQVARLCAPRVVTSFSKGVTMAVEPYLRNLSPSAKVHAVPHHKAPNRLNRFAVRCGYLLYRKSSFSEADECGKPFWFAWHWSMFNELNIKFQLKCG
jgi:hypothetical protein